MIALLLALTVQSAPFKPEEAPGKMTVPEGFKVTLFAGEPDDRRISLSSDNSYLPSIFFLFHKTVSLLLP